MVVPRKWKLVAGAMSATVAFGASGAAAQNGEEAADQPVLTEVVNIETLSQVGVPDDGVGVVEDTQIEQASPFDSAAEDSLESASVPSEDSESLPSEASPESEDSPASEDSPESESVPSEDSISADSND